MCKRKGIDPERPRALVLKYYSLVLKLHLIPLLHGTRVRRLTLFPHDTICTVYASTQAYLEEWNET